MGYFLHSRKANFPLLYWLFLSLLPFFNTASTRCVMENTSIARVTFLHLVIWRNWWVLKLSRKSLPRFLRTTASFVPHFLPCCDICWPISQYIAWFLASPRVMISRPGIAKDLLSKPDKGYSRVIKNGQLYHFVRLVGDSILAATGDDWPRQHRILYKVCLFCCRSDSFSNNRPFQWRIFVILTPLFSKKSEGLWPKQ